MTLSRIAAAFFLLASIQPHAAGAPSSTWLDFGLSSAAIARLCADVQKKAQARLEVLASVEPASSTFDSTFLAFSDALSDLNDEISGAQFLGEVSPHKEIRDASLACDTEISRYQVDVFSRADLYQALKLAAARIGPLPGEEGRFIEKTLLEFKRTGLELPDEQRKEVKELKQKIISLENDFRKNLNEEQRKVPFTLEQLAGLPQDYIKRLPRDGDSYLVSLDYPDYFPFMENAKDGEARRIIEQKFNTRGGKANVALLEEALRLRAKSAALLGYPTHAHWVLEDRMAKDPKKALEFLARLEKRLKEKGEPEVAELSRMKAAELGPKADKTIHAWDWRYYHNQMMKTRYQVDDQKIKEYFPLHVVTGGMLNVYQTLFGLKYREVKPAQAWHDDVQLFEVSDSSTNEVLGYFYMDLFPREGKYKHAAAYTLVPGRRLSDGSYQKPVAAMVANFNKPSGDKPSLLTHQEVETFFHEFGHIMHQVLTQARFERFSGTRVARDFVEAPSQMLENWVWQEKVLESLSGHYLRNGKKLPPELLKKMLAARNVNSGIKYLRQVFFATLDLTYHTQPVRDSTELYAKLMKEISLIPMSPDTQPHASFGHLMGGYDAAYYGYLWSEVFAQDMFSRFEKEGVLNPTLGRRYRALILEPGGGRDEMRSLVDFLGREPNEEAFLRDIGLKPKPR